MIDVRSYKVLSDAAGQRLDQYLTKHVTNLGLSRSQIQKLIEEEKIKVGGKVVSAHHFLRSGDVVSLIIPEPRKLEIGAEDIPLDIVFEDAHFLVVNKQRGLVTHPAPGHYDGTLVNALMFHLKRGLPPGAGAPERPGIVHRLDKDTTGCLVVAKTGEAFQSLTRQIQEGGAKRTYLGLVWGEFEEEEGSVEGPIGRDPKDRKKMAVVRSGGREAVTHFKVQERLGAATLLRLKLETGRTHQIRVHMATIKHPVIGDQDYGPKPFKTDQPLFKSLHQICNRQMLHAWKLAFRHPATNEPMEFTAPLPDDFERALAVLRKTT